MAHRGDDLQAAGHEQKSTCAIIASAKATGQVFFDDHRKEMRYWYEGTDEEALMQEVGTDEPQETSVNE